jgi:putative aldouronate transport system permease protein
MGYWTEKTGKFAVMAILLLMTAAALMPVLLIVVASLTDEKTLVANGYSFVPSVLSFEAYAYMFRQGNVIMRSYGVSFLVTIVGTLASVLLTTMIAYPMSRKKFKYRGALAFFVFFTMLFSGGIVPSYMMWTRLFSIKNTLWALIVPNYLVTAFNVFLVKNYYEHSVPESILESAQIDGASEFTVFFKIMFPLAVPVVATISIFTALIYWNDWVNGLYYLTNPRLYGIQNLLIRIMENIQYLRSGMANVALGAARVEMPSTSVRMAMAVIGILPIAITYPFAQKYFIKGVIVGAIKG